MQEWLQKRKVDLAEITLNAHLIAYLIVMVVVIENISWGYSFQESPIILLITIPATVFIILDYHFLHKDYGDIAIFIWNIFKHTALYTIITVALFTNQNEYIWILSTLYLLPVVLSCITLGQNWGLVFAGLTSLSIYLLVRNAGLPGNQAVEMPLILGGIFFLVAWFLGGITRIEKETTQQLAQINVQQKDYQKKLSYISLHDHLTGLYNRNYYDDVLERFSMGRDFPLTFISADLDNLKLINDTMGHHKGDELLKVCAQIMGKSLRSSDILCRIGGDEFVAILPQTDEEAGEKILARIVSEVELYNQNIKGPLFLGVSMGCATAKNDNIALIEKVKEASDLMYRDKLHHGIGTTHQIINSLIAMLGERDFVTEGHARRLEKLSLKMGEELSLSQKQNSNLSLLARIHDLGKVGIPDHILFKKGPLNDREWEIMKQHSEKGYRIALSSSELSEVADLILKHHEHWDGSGYPLGINGEEIPLECRILAIIDAYDAMVYDRPYRNALNSDQAIKELKKNSGTQFDPELVDIFVSIIEKDDRNGLSAVSN